MLHEETCNSYVRWGTMNCATTGTPVPVSYGIMTWLFV